MIWYSALHSEHTTDSFWALRCLRYFNLEALAVSDPEASFRSRTVSNGADLLTVFKVLRSLPSRSRSTLRTFVLPGKSPNILFLAGFSRRHARSRAKKSCFRSWKLYGYILFASMLSSASTLFIFQAFSDDYLIIGFIWGTAVVFIRSTPGSTSNKVRSSSCFNDSVGFLRIEYASRKGWIPSIRKIFWRLAPSRNLWRSYLVSFSYRLS